MMSFVYTKEGDMMKAQAVFIEIGIHILDYANGVNKFIKETYF